MSIATKPKYFLYACRTALEPNAYSKAVPVHAATYSVSIAPDQRSGHVEFTAPNGALGQSLTVPDDWEAVYIHKASAQADEALEAFVGAVKLVLQGRVVWEPHDAPMHDPPRRSATDGGIQVRVNNMLPSSKPT